ncbi:GNAT family N-acetyltransferase [Olivibacter ginsenosidimutans]|uniref:GNAT family N-acetyltransferase n=1 Tax=Olivibacter ginsenosidimutans TaxID=1176537 RepID=A0ABP9CBW2_9SPHI
MKEEFSALELIKNEVEGRFEMIVENQTAFVNYKERNQKIFLVHTQVPTALEGQGVASALIEKILQYMEENDYKLVALCPAVVAFIRRHPEWKRILDLEQLDLI